MACCDLHVHSYYSDGTLSPRALVEMAEALGLSAVALCDHNTVAGVPEFLEAGKNARVETIAGIEFSTDYLGTELHILALFVQPGYFAPIMEKMEEGKRQKEESNRALIRRLTQAGYPMDYEKVAARGKGRINRAHVAAEMTALGYTSSVQEAFSRFLNPKHGYYVPPKLPNAVEMIRYIRSIGAVPVWAHPFLSLKQETEVEGFLQLAVPAGLVGLEVLYSKYTPEQTERAKALVKRYGLQESGGSDFHGDNKPDIRMGTGRGDLRIPADYTENLRKYVKYF